MTKGFKAVIFGLVALLTLGAQAEDSRIIDQWTEVIFPQAVVFALDVTFGTGEIDSAVLTLDIPDHDPLELTVDPQVDVVLPDEPDARLRYVWNIPLENPPDFYSRIAYHWEVTPISDDEPITYAGEFIFRDPRQEWVQYDGTVPVTLYAPRTAQPLLPQIDEIYDQLWANTVSEDLTLPEFRLIIFDHDPACQPQDAESDVLIARGAESGFIVECTPGILDAVTAGFDVIVQPRGVTVERLVTEYLVRGFYDQVWGENANTVPVWFIEGLITFHEPSAQGELLAEAVSAARAGRLFTLGQMRDQRDTLLWRAQAFGMVLTIAESVGFDGLYELARMIGEAESFDAAYRQVMDAEPAALIPAWEAWLFSPRAESVYALNPYQDPTLTPTLTPTRTETLPPTRTPTLTYTPTVTPTPSLTPSPTRTRTPTWTPAPPTVTPRPPGSLPTLTPTPTLVENVIAQPGVQVGGIVIGILVVLLIVSFVVQLGDRR